MKTFWTVLILICILITYAFGENDYWTMEEVETRGFLETRGYTLVEYTSSHIIYKDDKGVLWTQCHTHDLWIPLEEAHEVEISWNGMLQVTPDGRTISSETVYYCSDCYKRIYK